MADTTALKNRIRAAIKANDNQEITGPVLQQSLLDIVDELNGATDDLDMIDAANSQVAQNAIDLTLRKNYGTEEDPEWRTLCHLLIPSVSTERAGLMSVAMRNLLYNLRNAGYAFGGIAVPDTNPGVPSGNCFYIIREVGTYTYFKNADNESIVIENDGFYVFTYESVENHYWEYNLITSVDDEPIAGSDNLVNSGGIERSNHFLSQKIDDLSLMTPVEIIDGKIMLGDGQHDNDNFSIYKYEIIPNRAYFFSGRFSPSTGINMVYVYSDSAFIASYGLPNMQVGVTYSDEYFVSPANSVYAYLNVSKFFNSAFCFAEQNSEKRNEALNNIISSNGSNVEIADIYDGMYYDHLNGNFHANKNFSIVKFKIDEKRTYFINITLESAIGVWWYADAQGNFLSYGGFTGPVELVNKQFTTPLNAQYLMCNVQWRDRYSVKLISGKVADIVNPVISPIIRELTPYEVRDGYFTIYTEERANASFEIRRFEVQPNRCYKIKGKFGNVDVPMIYLLNSSKSYVAHYFIGPNITADEWCFVTPPTTKYIYMNVQKAYSFSLIENGTDDDRTAEISAALNKYKKVTLQAGTYVVNNLEMPPYSTLEGIGNATILKHSGSADGDSAIKLTKYGHVKNILFVGSWDDIPISAPSVVDTISIGNLHGILMLGSSGSSDCEGNQVSMCEFRNFSGGGIVCDNTGIATSKGLIVSDCHMRNCGAGINISYNSEFNRFTNVEAHKCVYGVINNGGNNNYVNCDFSGNGIGVFFNGGTNKGVRYNGAAITPTNTAHGIMSGCTINHSGLSGNDNPGYAIVYLNSAGGFLFTGIQLHYGKMRFIDSESVQMCNCKFGYNVTLEAWSARLIVISNVTFNGLPGNSAYFKAKVCSDTSLTTRDTDYLSDGNLKKVRLINAYNYNGDQVTISSINNG